MSPSTQYSSSSSTACSVFCTARSFQYAAVSGAGRAAPPRSPSSGQTGVAFFAEGTHTLCLVSLSLYGFTSFRRRSVRCLPRVSCGTVAAEHSSTTCSALRGGTGRGSPLRSPPSGHTRVSCEMILCVPKRMISATRLIYYGTSSHEDRNHYESTARGILSTLVASPGAACRAAPLEATSNTSTRMYMCYIVVVILTFAGVLVRSKLFSVGGFIKKRKRLHNATETPCFT